MTLKSIFLISYLLRSYGTFASVPIVMNTWKFASATEKAWTYLKNSDASAIDAVVTGASVCEELQCDGTVGYGGSPDENGETTLDALIFDGNSMDMGAVAGLRRIKNAMNVARHVLDYSNHSMLVGDLATEFAKNFGFKEESLTTEQSYKMWNTWKQNKCQPNFWRNVQPNPREHCGPYQSEIISNGLWRLEEKYTSFTSGNHDTIGIIAIDSDGKIAAGTSTNGANHKIAGRVGDSPIPGAGAYADNEVGAAVATGDGDIMMRFLPSFLAVEEMRKGTSPTKAAQIAVNRIVNKYPSFMGAVLATTVKGDFGAACNGIESFPFVVASDDLGGVVIKSVQC